MANQIPWLTCSEPDFYKKSNVKNAVVPTFKLSVNIRFMLKFSQDWG